MIAKNIINFIAKYYVIKDKNNNVSKIKLKDYQINFINYLYNKQNNK